VRLGVVILPEQRWELARSAWRGAEEFGFDHAWTYDHLAWRSLRDSAWFGTLTTLAAAATATTRIRLGTLVTSPNFRHPVVLAKEAMTLDDLSGGRFTLGIGAGALGWDAAMLGDPPLSGPERAARFEEFVELLDALLREPRTSFDGRFYSAVEARSLPGCVQAPRVPFAIAATGPRGMHLAARFGQTWVTTGDRRQGEVLQAEDGAAVVKQQMQLLDNICLDMGRDPATIGRLVLIGPGLEPGLASLDAFRRTRDRYEEIGVTDLVVHWPRSTEPYFGSVKVLEEIMST